MMGSKNILFSINVDIEGARNGSVRAESNSHSPTRAIASHLIRHWWSILGCNKESMKIRLSSLTFCRTFYSSDLMHRSQWSISRLVFEFRNKSTYTTAHMLHTVNFQKRDGTKLDIVDSANRSWTKREITENERRPVKWNHDFSNHY